MDSGYKYIYMAQNWKIEKSRNLEESRHFNFNDLGYDFIGMDIDTAIAYPLCRKAISPKYYSQLNKEIWRINTIITSYGQITSVEFLFKDESGVNPREFAQLAELIKSKVKWKLYFNKEVKDLFHLEFNLQGPKF